MLSKVKRLFNRCDDCWKKADYHFWLPSYSGLDDPKERKEYEEKYNEKVSDYHLCFDHARTSGFCYGCHYFMAGIESFDFSEIKGLCSECVDDMKHELGEYDDIGEYYGEYEQYDDYGVDFSQKASTQSSTTLKEE